MTKYKTLNLGLDNVIENAAILLDASRVGKIENNVFVPKRRKFALLTKDVYNEDERIEKVNKYGNQNTPKLIDTHENLLKNFNSDDFAVITVSNIQSADDSKIEWQNLSIGKLKSSATQNPKDYFFVLPIDYFNGIIEIPFNVGSNSYNTPVKMFYDPNGKNTRMEKIATYIGVDKIDADGKTHYCVFVQAFGETAPIVIQANLVYHPDYLVNSFPNSDMGTNQVLTPGDDPPSGGTKIPPGSN